MSLVKTFKYVGWFLLFAVVASFALLMYGARHDSTILVKITKVHVCSGGGCRVTLENGHRFTINALVAVGDHARYDCQKNGLCYYDKNSFNLNTR